MDLRNKERDKKQGILFLEGRRTILMRRERVAHLETKWSGTTLKDLFLFIGYQTLYPNLIKVKILANLVTLMQ